MTSFVELDESTKEFASAKGQADPRAAKLANMPISRTTANTPAWSQVRERLAEMDKLLEPQAIDSLAVAKAFETVASALLIAVQSSGASSMRFTAVVKALNLKTAKSQLQTFLAEQKADE